MRNNLNPDRIRRHMARSTPDKIEFRVDLITDAGIVQYKRDLQRWMLKMQIKHDDNNMKIDMFRDDMLARFPGETVFKARYTPNSENVKREPEIRGIFSLPVVDESKFKVRKEDLEYMPFDYYNRLRFSLSRELRGL